MEQSEALTLLMLYYPVGFHSLSPGLKHSTTRCCLLFADVDDIKFVVNFDFPNSSEDYVHRIGRTGRATKTGTAYTFFTPNNMRQAADLVNILREAKQQVNPKLIQMAGSSHGLSKGNVGGGAAPFASVTLHCRIGGQR